MGVPRKAKYNAETVAANSVGETQLAANSVATAKIKDSNVTAAKLKYFVSNEITGTGSAQSTAHGLGTAPIIVLAIPTATATGEFTVTYGTHTSTNCVITVSSGAKYKILAIA